MEEPLTEGKSKRLVGLHAILSLSESFFISLCFAGLVLITIYKISPLSSLFSLLLFFTDSSSESSRLITVPYSIQQEKEILILCHTFHTVHGSSPSGFQVKSK